MKKRLVLFSILIILLIYNTSFFLAAENVTAEKTGVDLAYDCLREKVSERCSSISSEERIFSLLTIKECKNEVVSDSAGGECWPKSGCNIKTTAQAILALGGSAKAEDWLLAQKEIPSELSWFLQIESPEATICTITYDGSSYSTSINEDKKISSGAGSCLTLSEGGWWLKVSPDCYEKEFKISCDKQFLTSLLFKKTGSTTIHVSEKTTSASAEGTTTEEVTSLCFSIAGSCDYEGSLWAALILDHRDYDITPYLPYLVAMTEENLKFLPEAFLYSLTGYTDFRVDLLSKQKDTYWDESGDKFYDTSVALYPFKYEEPSEKTKSINWLLEVQDSDGCWQGNIRNTAFILYSIFSKDPGSTSPSVDDCEDAGYYCLSEINCEGEILPEYDCSGTFKCCDTKKSLETCQELGGSVCNSQERCDGGNSISASDLVYGEICCISGVCREPEPDVSNCEVVGNGACRSFCNDDEEESFSYTCDYGDACCVEKVNDKSYWWIWLLLILIILVILAIVFRDRVQPYWIIVKSKFRKTKTPAQKEIPARGFPPRGPPGYPYQRRPLQRRILPPGTSRKPVRHSPQKSGEIDEVLKKLKEMGK
ncbi:MAG: hypothetical protein KKF68_00055 [Nanoarchaeota archaeon]|nr:hypothetical protein [Nanoarchaeota archaeon]